MAEYEARAGELLTEELDGGLVIYDTRSHEAHWLDDDAAAVWRACPAGASASETEIAEAAGVDLGAAVASLTRLGDVGLVREVVLGEPVSRRTMLGRAARVGIAGAVAAPIISTLIPVAAAHASTVTTGTGGNCGCGGTIPQGASCGGDLSDRDFQCYGGQSCQLEDSKPVYCEHETGNISYEQPSGSWFSLCLNNDQVELYNCGISKLQYTCNSQPTQNLLTGSSCTWKSGTGSYANILGWL